MKHFTRVFFIVLDGCGVGELPDASDYGDAGASTIPHVAAAAGGLCLPCLQSLGLGNIIPIEGVPPADEPLAAYGKMAERAAGKDSTSGHWEHFGVILEKPFPVYPDGFPDEVIREFTARTGYDIIGNQAASGTEIIERLGEQHLREKKLIVYTSVDSVFQIAAHTSVIAEKALYKVCEIARSILTGRHAVGRVIARPFEGPPGRFTRTPGRRDFSVSPPSPFVTEKLIESGIPVHAIGKIADILVHQGISRIIPAAGNAEYMARIVEAATADTSGLIIANLGDFDTLWGHRNDSAGFARGLEEFDRFLPNLLDKMRTGDLLILTADHGCDPTLASTDHSREFVPLVVYFPGMLSGIDLGTRESFSDNGATLAENFNLGHPFPGGSFWKDIQHEDSVMH